MGLRLEPAAAQVKGSGSPVGTPQRVCNRTLKSGS